MSAKIHPLADVDPGASLGDAVEIGAFCHVGPHATIGAGTRLHAHASVIGHTTLGAQCVLHAHAIVGGAPQVIGNEPDRRSRLEIGDRTVFREYASAHTGLPDFGGTTRIGTDGYIMIGAHIGHDCQVGNHCVLANSAALAGHITLGDHVWMGGLSAIHQFSHVGEHAFIAGGAIVVGDVIPFGTAVGNRATLAGLNVKGLARRGFSRDRIKAMRRGYKALFDTGGSFAEAVEAAKQAFAGDADVSRIIAFIEMERARPLCFPARP
ncbi:MAG: acyl-ACP--UDP-N-acetylglucosamine O-acyltransferase [Pseudomonadota bacterium]